MGRPTPELHNSLADTRRAFGLTQGELARAVSVSRQTISSIEQGNYNPSASLALKLSVLLGVPMESLFSLPDTALAELKQHQVQLQASRKEEFTQ
ncbi:MAG: helix-turn-helix transcriptional regulator [Dehalococcoidia bacterium]